MTRAYELTVLLAPTLASDEVTKLQTKLSEQITGAGGKVTGTDVWGRKLLAYTIGKHDEAMYIHLKVMLPADKAQALEQSVKHTEGVIRHLLVLAEDEGKPKE